MLRKFQPRFSEKVKNTEAREKNSPLLLKKNVYLETQSSKKYFRAIETAKPLLKGAKKRKTSPSFDFKTQTARYYRNCKTAQKPHLKSAKTPKRHTKIGENRKTANL